MRGWLFIRGTKLAQLGRLHGPGSLIFPFRCGMVALFPLLQPAASSGEQGPVEVIPSGNLLGQADSGR